MDGFMINRKKQIRAVCMSAMCASLSTVFLILGQALQVFDMSAAVLGGLITASVSISFGIKYAAAQSLVCAVLSFILLPDKTAAVLYLTAGGAYPLLKPIAERTRFSRIIKLAVAEAIVAIYIGACMLFLPDEFSPVLIAVGVVLGTISFLLYDVLLTLMQRRYGERIKRAMQG